MERVGGIMNGEVNPYRSFIVGNDYFGRVQFKFCDILKGLLLPHS